MRGTLLKILLACSLFLITPSQGYSQLAIAEIIKAGIKRVIKAADLRIQRLQNQTIWLQNARKQIENLLSKIRLQEIADWSQRQRDLYENYYQELTQVKAILASYGRVAELLKQQRTMLTAYQTTWRNLESDTLFSIQEKDHMQRVYRGMLKSCLENLELLALLVKSLRTQMSDAERLTLMQQAQAKIQQHYLDMKEFNNQNALLRIHRAKQKHELNQLKNLYNLQ
ncbi:conjugal transfer protein TraI [Sphingobacterium sp. DK4209]|uniref:Conjugal transfer protein TraI n=1 Tax=Sphingobacterium zhuxiongii TaxID=2662364 RepID=A0A5Q0QEF0_9SPHI|nr:MULTISPECIES: conjugal transfer protein TraI [unclassified Sphingobacterium]MVZ65724.1 conjugal transfer protein TraI [Sphingobacterium sp. DK4209]QGA27923.1 conjugal transfer protein TraI [Sphingobacterium sp. dk4302]